MAQLKFVFIISLILGSMVSGCYNTYQKGRTKNLGKDPATEDHFIKVLNHTYKVEKVPTCSDPSFTLHFYVTHQYGTTSKIKTYDLKTRTNIGNRFAEKGLQAGGSIIGAGLTLIGVGIQQNQDYTTEGIAVGAVGVGVAVGGLMSQKNTKEVNVTTKKVQSEYPKEQKLFKGELAVAYTPSGGEKIEKIYSLNSYSAGTVTMDLGDFGINLSNSGERTYVFDLTLDGKRLGSIEASGSIDPRAYIDCLTTSMKNELNFSKSVGVENMLKQEIYNLCPQTSRELEEATFQATYNVLTDFGFEHERASAYSLYIIRELPCDAGRF